MLRLPIGVTSFSEDARMQGVNLTSTILKTGVEEIHSELDRRFFGSKTGGKIFVLKRVRKADGVPVTVEENHLPPELVSLEEEDLTGSLYDILINKYHMVPSNKGRRSIKITFADEEIAEALGLSRGTPVIESEMCVFDMSGEPIHTVKDWVRGDNDQLYQVVCIDNTTRYKL